MMTQKKGILIAGTLTGLILMTLLAFSFTNVATLFARDDAQVVQPAQSLESNAPVDSQALQEYATELESALQTMQQREAEYQQQLQAANQTIIEMQQPVQSSPGIYADDDHYEHDDDDEYEHDDD